MQSYLSWDDDGQLTFRNELHLMNIDKKVSLDISCKNFTINVKYINSKIMKDKPLQKGIIFYIENKLNRFC